MHSLPTVGVFGQNAACRIEGLRFFLLQCRIAVLLFFSACGFFYLRLCAFCVVTVGFVSLYVSEFFFAACGVSLLRERPAISQAPRGLPKGWTPTLFSFGAGLLVLFVLLFYTIRIISRFIYTLRKKHSIALKFQIFLPI